MNFASDNTAPAAPQILDALARANVGAAASYGDDEWTARVEAKFHEIFERDVAVFLTVSGTAANAIALGAITPPWGVIACHPEAHIDAHELGAAGFYSGGARLTFVDGPGAKVSLDALRELFARDQVGVHTIAPSTVSITQASERGDAYAPEEIAAIAELTHANNALLHMDGARFANALVHAGCSPADMTWRAGVDVMSFGATKNGAFAAEAIVLFDPTHAEAVARQRMRGGHLLSKHRFIAAQMLGYLESDLWLRLARRTNAFAARIAEAAGARLSNPCGSNLVIIRASADEAAALRAQGIVFYNWPPNDIRIVVSWDQDEADVEALCGALRGL